MQKGDMSEGKPWKVLLLFALPMILSITLQQIYNIADSAIAGRLIGEDALASVSASYPITMIYIALANGLGIGVGVVVSRFFGMHNLTKVKTTISSSLLVFMIVAVTMGVLGFFLTEGIISLLKTDVAIAHDSASYLKIYCLGFVFQLLYNIVTYIFQAIGNSRTPLYFLIFSTILNVVLDILFVLCTDMGITGIALATLISQMLASIAAFLYLLWTVRKWEVLQYERFSWGIMKNVLAIAIPSVIQGSIVAIGGLFVQSEINSYGKEITAGYGAAYKLSYIVVNIFLAISNAMSNFTSQNIGAKTEGRIGKGFKAALLMSLIFSVITILIYMLFVKQLLYVFLDSNKSQNVIIIGTRFIYIVVPFFTLVAIKVTVDGVLKGAGDMRNFMIGTFIDLILRIIFTFVFSRCFGYEAIWWSWPVGWILATLFVVIMFMVGRWKKVSKKMS